MSVNLKGGGRGRNHVGGFTRAGVSVHARVLHMPGCGVNLSEQFTGKYEDAQVHGSHGYVGASALVAPLRECEYFCQHGFGHHGVLSAEIDCVRTDVCGCAAQLRYIMAHLYSVTSSLSGKIQAAC